MKDIIKLNIMDFGADPTGVESSVPALRKAAAAAKEAIDKQIANLEAGSSEIAQIQIVFPAGKFFMGTPSKVPDGMILVGESFT